MKLYYCPRTRSGRPRWLLEELGVPYELERIDLSKGEHKRPEYLKVHPHGVVPALKDGELTLIESAAICMYLADKYSDKKLAPAVGTADRGRYYQWMMYGMATMEPPVLDYFLHGTYLPEPKRIPALVDQAQTKVADVSRVLDSALGEKPYILGEQFSAADVLIGSTVAWGKMMGLFQGHPRIDSYFARLSERPAFKRAHAD